MDEFFLPVAAAVAGSAERLRLLVGTPEGPDEIVLTIGHDGSVVGISGRWWSREVAG